MIRKIRINNYKSIPDLSLELGRVTVLIGANGSGKSNILEAIALASAVAQDKLDNEFLTSRGIRVTDARFMSSAFGDQVSDREIAISVEGNKDVKLDYRLRADHAASYPKWSRISPILARELQGQFEQLILEHFRENGDKLQQFIAAYTTLLEVRVGPLSGFLVYAPENSALRTFQSEGQILPLGIKGEGLFAHLKALSSEKYRPRLDEIKSELGLIEWFEGFEIPDDLSPGERSIRISDRYLPMDALFDQRSANEGFLFLLFYVTLLISPDTPAFFSIDNIDSSLNPKMCVALLKQMVALAKKYDKQVILTTHNPAVLDGLDLHDDEQRLLVVDRNKSGHTRVRRIDPPKPAPGQVPVALSEAFLRGYIGGLPNNF